MDYNFEVIDKERIGSLNFPTTDVLDDDKEAIKQRKDELDRALTLGNLEHHKIKIYFEDDTSKKMVDTTIWGLTEERIILKQGVVIPINRIYKTI
ncbi:hypothetical protein FEDK69T_29460 [Flavobacterium enshiense DK69]|uniref:Uncharacterized protein n=1 Tax=Flavobacterium enshiense DK69 TaxID=1107311 RepID=V6S2E7_9FLAO|nr:hypothetical protein [Flavobacterium enshiense]ESU20427.1 hypothetical protein FEDK69T_29460 [Flavobacterium enshiense DK69]KGO95769.1 hypothetical protein Q767_08745 [Flavobacterium enshiense DK69]